MASRGRWERLFLFSLPLALVVHGTSGIFGHLCYICMAFLLNILFNKRQERNKRATFFFFSVAVLLFSPSAEIAAVGTERLVVIKA